MLNVSISEMLEGASSQTTDIILIPLKLLILRNLPNNCSVLFQNISLAKLCKCVSWVQVTRIEMECNLKY